MPVVTQTRITPAVHRTYECKYNGQMRFAGSLDYPTGSQTTTSFRSGPKFEPYVDDSVTAAATSTDSGLEAYRREFHKLREETNGQFDTGHEFQTRRSQIDYILTAVTLSKRDTTGGLRTYTGHMYPTTGTTSEYADVAPAYPSRTTIQADGRKAIQRTIPSKPEAGIATFLGELRESLPQFVGHAVAVGGSARRVYGQEYLNLQFGIRPFISDIQKMARSVLHAASLLRQYQRDSGRVVRRRYKLYETSKVTLAGSYVSNPYWVQPTGFTDFDLGVSYGPVYVTDLQKSVASFSGAYSYHLSKGHSFLGKLEEYEQKAQHLLGIEITPDVLWELTPWSWLLDWQGDIGTFMSNVTSLSDDSTVLRYGYVMHHTSSVRIRSQMVYQGGRGTEIRRESTQYEKLRTKSTPYGFDALVSNFTSKQWSILAALGMTKSATVLR